MSYKPKTESKHILRRAWDWVQSVPYAVTARWVFYRLLQDGIYADKKGYKHLLGILSKARKGFYGPWKPWSLADDTRAPILMQREGFYTLHLRGWGFKTETEWLEKVKTELNCQLDRWVDQPIYAEVWFEAAAMQGQFLHYANPNLPLLAFHGDVSIPEKWRAAQRLSERWLELRKPIHIFYYGDLDPKGLIIPLSAWSDIRFWILALLIKEDSSLDKECMRDFIFTRVGINREQVADLDIPENPERPGTYQWEALSDEQAETLIEKSSELLDPDAFSRNEKDEWDITEQLRDSIQNLGK